MTDAKLAALIERLEAATLKLEGVAKGSGGTPSPPAGGEKTGPALGAFDELSYPPVAIALASKQPDQKLLQELIKPLQGEIMHVTSIKEKNRPSPFFSHLSMVADGVPALGWVVVSPTPAPYITEMKDAAQFYANRVIKEWKDKDPCHAKWVAAFAAFLADLFAYVKKWHTTGLAWNPKGGDASAAASSTAAAPSAPSAAGAPPPPPAPSAAQLEALAAGKESKPATANFLGELSKGTSGLRKVDKSEMTHKNPELRATSVVPATQAKGRMPCADPGAVKGPPKLQLDGNKWSVENQFNNPEVVIEGTEIKHVVYIYNCQNSTIKIVGKVNAITIDGCKKVGVLVDNVVSTLDTVNSSRVQIQITGKCPTAVVDKTDGYQLYLSKECEGIELLSAKSSEMNILTLNDQGEYGEQAVSEQFKTVLKGGKLVTEAVEHKE
ncbi:F-actin-capping protein subunit alpha [Kappamyces sp. JEL0680]|nr:F-actin-capping protein subunit alpha [Kappamyces sp. JEL0680]